MHGSLSWRLRVPICLTVLDSSALGGGRLWKLCVNRYRRTLLTTQQFVTRKTQITPNPLFCTAWDMTVVLRELLISSRWEVCSWSQTVADPARLHAPCNTPGTPPLLPPLFNFTSTTTIPGWTHFYRPQYVYINELFYRGVDESVYVMFVWSEWKWCCLV